MSTSYYYLVEVERSSSQVKQIKAVMKRKNNSVENIPTNKKAVSSIQARNSNINQIVQSHKHNKQQMVPDNRSKKLHE